MATGCMLLGGTTEDTDSGVIEESGDDCDTEDTGSDCFVYTGETFILDDTVANDCTETEHEFAVRARGASGGAKLYIRQTGASPPWNEDHSLSPAETAESGYWTDLAATLTKTGDPGAIEDGTTLFQCAEARLQTLTFYLEVYKTDGEPPADCVSWGHSPGGDERLALLLGRSPA